MKAKLIIFVFGFLVIGSSFGEINTNHIRLSSLDAYKDGMLIKSFNTNNVCDVYENGKFWSHQERERCGEIPPGEWSVTFDYGTLIGEVSCNSISGIVPEIINQEDILVYVSETMHNDDTGHNCWCRIIGFVSSDGEKQLLPSSSWVFNYNSGSDSSCKESCVYICADTIRDNSVFRKAIFNADNM